MKKHCVCLTSLIVSLLLTSCGNNDIVNVFPVKIGEHWGFVNDKGKYIVNPIYEDADYFSCGIARFVKDGKVGYIDPKGKIVIEPIYARGTSFSEDKAFVVIEGEAIECINLSGKVLFSAEGIEWAYNYHEGYAKVVNGAGKSGYIDSKGKIFIEPIYDAVGDFSEGLAFVSSKDYSGYINKNKELVITSDVDNAYAFKDGLAINNINDGLYGFINKKGEVSIPYQFDEAKEFREGLSCVKTGDKYGYIDSKGVFVVNPQFKNASSFFNGLAVVRDGRKYGYINKKGKVVIDAIYVSAHDFFGDYAFVENSDEKYGLINKKGEFVVKPQFSYAKVPDDKIIGVRSGKFNGVEFVPAFLKRYASDEWDGLSGNSTLSYIRKIYSKAKASGEDTFVCETSFEPIDGVKLTKMEFGFGTQTYKVVKNYTSFFGYSYENGTKRQYIETLPLKSLRYTFSLEGNAINKAKSIAIALAEGISSTYGVGYEAQDSSLDLPASDSTPCTTLTWSSANVYLTINYAE